MHNNAFFKWLQSNFDKDELIDMVNYGCRNGFSGLIYYDETNQIFNQFEKEILEIIKHSGFECPIKIENYTLLNQFMNDIVWLACELAAYELIN